MNFNTSFKEQPVFQPLSPDIHDPTQGVGRVTTTAYDPNMTPVSYKILSILDGSKRVFIRDIHHKMEGWHIVGPGDKVTFIPCYTHPTLN